MHIPALSKFVHNNAAPSEKSLPTPALVGTFFEKKNIYIENFAGNLLGKTDEN